MKISKLNYSLLVIGILCICYPGPHGAIPALLLEIGGVFSLISSKGNSELLLNFLTLFLAKIGIIIFGRSELESRTNYYLLLFCILFLNGFLLFMQYNAKPDNTIFISSFILFGASISTIIELIRIKKASE